MLTAPILGQSSGTTDFSNIASTIILGAIGSILAAFVLAVLGYVFRPRLRFIVRKIFYDFLFFGIEGFYTSQEEFEQELDLSVRTSSNIKILTYRGARGCEFIFRNRKFLIDKKIEVILANPYSEEGIRWINFRDQEIRDSGYYDKSTERETGQSYVNRTKLAIQEFINLKSQLEANKDDRRTVLSINIYSEKPIWCFYIFDDVIYIGGFTEFDLGRFGSFYKVSKKSVLYRASLRQFDYIKQFYSVEYNPPER